MQTTNVLVISHDPATRVDLASAVSRIPSVFLMAGPDLRPADILPPDIVVVDESSLSTLPELERSQNLLGARVILVVASFPDLNGMLRGREVDYLPKPVSRSHLERLIRAGLVVDKSAAFPSLTPREKEVLDYLLSGATNKEVGRRLEISPRTVELHRSRVMQKIGARNVADLARIVWSARPAATSPTT